MARWDDEEFNTQLPPDNIQCATCKHKLESVKIGDEVYDRSGYGICEKYDLKPQGVLWNGDKCDKYEEG